MGSSEYSVRERFTAVMSGDLSKGIPIIEWAGWWDQTLNRWYADGMPKDVNPTQWFGLDMHRQIWVGHKRAGCPGPQAHGQGIMADDLDYEKIKEFLYPRPSFSPEVMKEIYSKQADGEHIFWFTLEGPFWFPRTLFGIAGHLYAFYDYPELMKRINADLANHCIEIIDAICEYGTPDFMTFAEDMSYNHGPMISYDLMDEFMAPFYHKVIPHLKSRGILAFIDSDGGIEPLIPWFSKVGIQGILPLERMAGVDVSRIREQHPNWLMIGGFDKTVMHLGEAVLAAEFERIRPAVLGGYYVPSCDHQTPPSVSVEDYRLYVRMMKEFSTGIANEYLSNPYSRGGDRNGEL